jgi:hypothetical protein
MIVELFVGLDFRVIVISPSAPECFFTAASKPGAAAKILTFRSVATRHDDSGSILRDFRHEAVVERVDAVFSSHSIRLPFRSR